MHEPGSGVVAASRRWARPTGEWLDLSTAISPWCWMEESRYAPDAACWHHLPDPTDDTLERAASAHYGGPALAVAITPAALQALPALRSPGARVGLLAPGDGALAACWQRAGHAVQVIRGDEIEPRLDNLDVVVLANPSNPEGRRVARARLADWHARLTPRGGWLVVDEAFADADAEDSAARLSTRPGLVVLRSIGPFFGLAGARVGFVLCADPLRAALREHLGAWPVSGPSREVALRALRDRPWQQRQRARLQAARDLLQSVLNARGWPARSSCALFAYVRCADAAARAERMAEHGVLVHDDSHGLRIGLPRHDAHWNRLGQALDACTRESA